MATVFDVAKYILKKNAGITHMKLQKLVYYSQAWSLVWDEAPLFDERIEAWANGPVAPDLYRELRGKFHVVEAILRPGDAAQLTDPQRETIDSILKTYGPRPPQWLSDLTHMERPWKDAREGLGVGVQGSKVITHASMAEYYGSL